MKKAQLAAYKLYRIIDRAPTRPRREKMNWYWQPRRATKRTLRGTFSPDRSHSECRCYVCQIKKWQTSSS